MNVDTQADLTPQNLITFLSEVEGFDQLSKEELEVLILPMISVVDYVPGQLIIKHGTMGSNLFVIFQGTIRVVLGVINDKPLEVEQEKGCITGEMALISNAPRSADIYAANQVIALVLDIETFQTLMMQNARICKAFARLIGRRILQNHIRSLESS
ncbi:MAG: cyclic nucleotide-binding domain-containing protein [Magnetococcales bacterium]|nr:cyclic nucleotide-binding domain-containing protein [Magnetococcales bacterium]